MCHPKKTLAEMEADLRELYHEPWFFHVSCRLRTRSWCCDRRTVHTRWEAPKAGLFGIYHADSLWECSCGAVITSTDYMGDAGKSVIMDAGGDASAASAW